MLYPHTTKLNIDKMLFYSFAEAGKYCGLNPTYPQHFNCVDIVGNIPIDLIGGAVSCT